MVSATSFQRSATRQFPSDDYWQSNIGPQLLGNGSPSRDDNNSSREGDLVEARRALKDTLVVGDEEPLTRSHEAQRIDALEILLPGISAYLPVEIAAARFKCESYENTKSNGTLPLFDSPYLGNSGRLGHHHGDKRPLSSSEPASSSMNEPNIVSSPPVSSLGAATKRRRARTVRISAPGQNPQRAWERKVRRDSVVESEEAAVALMNEYDKIDFDKTAREEIDCVKQR